MKKAQSWSIDVIIGVVIFMLIVAIFYAFINAQSENSVEELKSDADTISERLVNNLGVLEEGEINVESLETLCDLPYDEVKTLLGIKSDVCIFLEDENGNIIPCGRNSNQLGIGKVGDIGLTDEYSCGEAMT